MRPWRLGVSPCPNDTFIFGGLALGLAEAPGPGVELFLAEKISFMEIPGLIERCLERIDGFDGAEGSVELELERILDLDGETRARAAELAITI